MTFQEPISWNVGYSHDSNENTITFRHSEGRIVDDNTHSNYYAGSLQENRPEINILGKYCDTTINQKTDHHDFRYSNQKLHGTMTEIFPANQKFYDASKFTPATNRGTSLYYPKSSNNKKSTRSIDPQHVFNQNPNVALEGIQFDLGSIETLDPLALSRQLDPCIFKVLEEFLKEWMSERYLEFLNFDSNNWNSTQVCILSLSRTLNNYNNHLDHPVDHKSFTNKGFSPSYLKLDQVLRWQICEIPILFLLLNQANLIQYRLRITQFRGMIDSKNNSKKSLLDTLKWTVEMSGSDGSKLGFLWIQDVHQYESMFKNYNPDPLIPLKSLSRLSAPK